MQGQTLEDMKEDQYYIKYLPKLDLYVAVVNEKYIVYVYDREQNIRLPRKLTNKIEDAHFFRYMDEAALAIEKFKELQGYGHCHIDYDNATPEQINENMKKVNPRDYHIPDVRFTNFRRIANQNTVIRAISTFFST